MRHYISNRDLTLTLNRLVTRTDPRLIKVYAQLYCYKENPKDEKLAAIGKVLESPRRLVLSLINTISLGIILYLIPTLFWSMEPNWAKYGLIGAAISLLILFALQSWRNYLRLLSYSDYIIVDELMERGIIHLRRD